MTIEERYKILQDRKYREDLERQQHLGAAQNAAKQLEQAIEKLRVTTIQTNDDEIKNMFNDLLVFYDNERLLDKEYVAQLFKKCQEVELTIEKFADELVK